MNVENVLSARECTRTQQSHLGVVSLPLSFLLARAPLSSLTFFLSAGWAQIKCNGGTANLMKMGKQLLG